MQIRAKEAMAYLKRWIFDTEAEKAATLPSAPL